MKTAPASLLLGVSVLLLSRQTVSEVSLNVSPNLQQFFSGDSVSLSCVEDGHTGEGWTVKRTRGGQTEECEVDHQDFGLFEDSTCFLDLLPSYSGVYWCETSSGQRTDQINITVARKDKDLILEIPALPVMAGSDVTLRCKNKDGSTRAAFFLRNNKVTGDKAKVQEFTISEVQQSEEGLYSCSTDVSEPSPQSWLRVTDPPTTSGRRRTSLYALSENSTATPNDSFLPPSLSLTPPPSSPPPPSPPPCISVIRLLLYLLVVCTYCICTVLMVLNYHSRKTGRKPDVYMEMTQHDGGGLTFNEENDYVTMDVTTEHDLQAVRS
ncbi:hypothetical protein Q5P01_003152 [Channa striata]|uniref:Immunoglobulin domain-containing protein n=1 Tax=Channa striata TaxID=64152 RepID=A0AA88NVI7_CHASR|nr:hypothetical protein Q5P01_003152 [Channa striata]